MVIRLLSWNVNGIRAVLRKGFLDFLNNEKHDIVCLQELKAQEDTMPKEIKNQNYFMDFSYAKKKGYSGVGILSKIKPLSIIKGLGIEKFDDEGRCITFEFEDFYLVNAYFPNSQRGLARLDYKIEFDNEFLSFVNELQKKKPVVFTGDLNVAHTEIDLKNPKSNENNPGFYIDERKWFDKVVDQGYIDTFRYFNKEPGHYTWWSYMFNARAKDIGWRIDYFVTSPSLEDNLSKAEILKNQMGSDHCPIALELEFKNE